MKKRVLIVSQFYFPDIIGVAKYTSEFAEGLTKRGWVVDVVCPPPFYPEWIVKPGYSATRYKFEQINSININRVPTFIPRRPSGLKRILHIFVFGLLGGVRAVFLALKYKPSVILTIEPTITAAPLCTLAAKIINAVSWLHIQDLEVEAAFELGLVRGVFLRKIVSSFDRFLMRSFHQVSTISANMKAKIEGMGVSSERLSLMRNWANLDDIRPLGRVSQYRAELGIATSTCVVMYSGSMAGKQGLETIVEAAQLLEARADILFILCGAGVFKSTLELMCRERSNCLFLPLQPVERLGEFLGLADIHLLPQKKAASDLVLPSKLSGMLASGKPIICGAFYNSGIAAEVVGAGLLVEPEDVSALANAIVTLATNPELRQRLGKEGRRLAEANWEMSGILDNFELKVEKLNRRLS